MTDIYLSRVRLQDFRTFGEFDVQIPPGPGLTMLVGTNGLGKSSFFDAIEWGLTGQVRRLLRYLPQKADEASYLRRRGAKSAHGVALEFSDGHRLHREGPLRPDAKEVVDLLKKAEWDAGIEDIGTYLAFTHFLGQAEPQRFTSRDPGDQWKALKGPSGIDRLEDIRQGLRGRATSLAFTRRINAENQAVEDAEETLANWRALRDRLQFARDSAGAAGGIDPEGLRLRLIRLDERLYSDLGIAAEATRDDGVIAILTRQLGVLQTDRSSIQQAVRRLDDLSTAPQRYAVQLAAASEDAAGLVAARQQVELTRAQETAASQAALKAQTASTTAASDLADRRERFSTLGQIRVNRTALAAISAELQTRVASRHQIQSDLDALRPELPTIDVLLSEGRQRAEAISVLAAGMAAATDLASKAEQLPQLAESAGRAAETTQALEQLAEASRGSLPQLAVRRDELTAERDATRADLARARERGTAMAAAISQIAAHLHEDDADCPVCRSRVGAGELLRLARDSAVSQGEELAFAEERDARLSTNLAAVGAEIAAADLAISNYNLARGTLQAADAAFHQQQALVRAGLPEGVTDLLASARAAQAAATEAFNQAIQATKDDSALTADATARRATLVSQIAALETRLSEIDASITADEARKTALTIALQKTGHLGTLDAEFEKLVTDAEAALSGAQATAEAAGRDAAAAVKAQLDAGEQVRLAGQTLTAAETARAAAQAGVAVLEAAWKREGLRGGPDAAELERRRSDLLARSALVEALEDERAQLAAAHDLTQNQKSLQALIAEMETLGGAGAADDPQVHETVLGVRLEAANEALARVRTVNLVVRKFSKTLRERAETFSRDFLAPLNDLIGAYNEALLSNPGDSIRFQADNRIDKTNFEMGLTFRERWEDNLFDKSLPPQVVLSEGQMAANGFSILCAASTAYPWSRWRALMLDDPLQHNDIIHAAAFVDLMRNLVEMQGYQLIMSSHDRAEAEFIARKFDAADLPCKLINLTAPSRSGVRYEEPAPNKAAQDLLQAFELSA